MESQMNTETPRMNTQEEAAREQLADETHGGGEKKYRHGHCHGRQGQGGCGQGGGCGRGHGNGRGQGHGQGHGGHGCR